MALPAAVPLMVGGGLIQGGLNFFGARDQNRKQRAAVDRKYQYDKNVYEFQYGDIDSDELGGEALRQYQFAVDGLEITKANNEANLDYQERRSMQRYGYDMGIRAYEFNQANRVYNQSVSRALNQQSLNELAESAALTDQDRLYHEQMIGLALDEEQTLLAYGAAMAGAGLKKRASKTASVASAQQERIATLKATGASQARGTSGRTAAKNIQGLLAESSARQRTIVDQFLFDSEATDQDIFKMNQQLIIDQVGFEFTRDSAKLSDMQARTKIKAQALQAALDAEASIALKPEISPPMPIPLALPRPEYQDVYRPAKAPPPLKGVAMTTNPFLAATQGILDGAKSGLSLHNALGK